jgi:hypothetical protein
MQTQQYKWLRGRGWTPELPTTEAGAHNIVLAFGARQLLQEGGLVSELRKNFPGSTVIGCSTSGEIAGDEVTDDSLVATVIGFDHTRFRTAHTTIGEGKSSREVGKELAQQLGDNALRHVFVISDGLKVNGSELAKGRPRRPKRRASATGPKVFCPPRRGRITPRRRAGRGVVFKETGHRPLVRCLGG